MTLLVEGGTKNQGRVLHANSRHTYWQHYPSFQVYRSFIKLVSHDLLTDLLPGLGHLQGHTSGMMRSAAQYT